MSPGVVPQPRLTRIAEPASPAGTPMAVSTWEGLTLPLEQADPALTANPGKVQGHDLGLAGGAGHRYAGRVGDPGRGMAVKDGGFPRFLRRPDQPPLHVVPQFGERALGRQPFARQPRRDAEPCDAGDVLGPGPPPVFLPAAAQHRARSGCRRARSARRRPAVPPAYGPTASSGRCQGHPRRAEACRRPGRRRNGRARHARGRCGPRRPAAGSRRSRC